MNNDPQPSRNNPQLPSWFSNDPQPSIAGARSAAPAPRPKRTHMWVIALVVIVILTAGAGALVYFMQTPTACLTPQDYTEISGGAQADSEGFDPKTDFFSASFMFQPDSSAYSTDDTDQRTNDIRRLAAFYKAHSDKPMLISLATIYRTEAGSQSVAIANQRLHRIRDDLVAAGIPSSIILSAATAYDVTEEDESPDLPDGVTLNLTSAATCDE